MKETAREKQYDNKFFSIEGAIAINIGEIPNMAKYCVVETRLVHHQLPYRGGERGRGGEGRGREG